MRTNLAATMTTMMTLMIILMKITKRNTTNRLSLPEIPGQEKKDPRHRRLK